MGLASLGPCLICDARPKLICVCHLRLELDSIDNYVYRRQLRWVGHVSRMPFDRLPRRMLSSWVAAKRPSGGQLMTYGRSVYKALDNFGISRETWPALAADRVAWLGAIHGSLLSDERPTRAAAAATNRRIAVSAADARASARNIGASVVSSLAHAALRNISASEANARASAANPPTRAAPPARGVYMVGNAPPTGAAPPPLRRSARLQRQPLPASMQ